MIAFDHMRLRLSDFEWAWQFIDVFAACVSNEKGGEDEPEAKRVKK